MSASTTIEVAGRRAGRGLWLASRCFELAGRASAGVADPSRRIGLGVAARRHGGHAQRWHGLLPAVPHLAVDDLVHAPAAPLDAWFAAATAGPDPAADPDPEDLAALHDLLVAGARGLFTGWQAAAAPWTDAPERRVLGQVLADLGGMAAGAPADGGPRAATWASSLAVAGGLAVGVAHSLR